MDINLGLGIGTVIFVALLILAVVTAAKGIRTVPQGEVWTVERFGAFTSILQPGLNFIIPYIDGIGRRVNVQEQVLDIPEQHVITRDNATVQVDGIVYYRVMDAPKAAYAVQDLTQALQQLSMTNIRSVVGEMDLDATLSGRDRINTALLTILDGATEPWGAKISRVEIKRIEPPENLIRAMNLQMTAERERRATVAKAEGDREAEVKRAEGARTAAILAAEGRKEAAFRDAEARERSAEAEAKATEMVAQVAAGAGVQALQYFIAEKYVKAFEVLAGNPAQKLVLVPMESTALAGGITAALELLRNSSEGGAPPSLPRPPRPTPTGGPPPGAPPGGGGSPMTPATPGSPWTRG
jgi:regulator of protease activity HflC (stomatin/prohibitin superfamily)